MTALMERASTTKSDNPSEAFRVAARRTETDRLSSRRSRKTRSKAHKWTLVRFFVSWPDELKTSKPSE
jgi:hypothetical protein